MAIFCVQEEQARFRDRRDGDRRVVGRSGNG
jgi:hypothetical protein